MRLIDADELIERVKAAPIREKNKVIGLIHTERTSPCEKMIAYLDKEAYGQDFFMRGIRYVPVVMCKECEYYTAEEKWCRRLGLCGAFDGEGYCSHGEFRKGEV